MEEGNSHLVTLNVTFEHGRSNGMQNIQSIYLYLVIAMNILFALIYHACFCIWFLLVYCKIRCSCCCCCWCCQKPIPFQNTLYTYANLSFSFFFFSLNFFSGFPFGVNLCEKVQSIKVVMKIKIIFFFAVFHFTLVCHLIFITLDCKDYFVHDFTSRRNGFWRGNYWNVMFYN